MQETKASQDELYQRVVREYGSALGRLAYAYEADEDRRRDLVQEIHIALWRSFEKFGERCSLRTWVYRVAHNVATSHVIRQSRRNGLTFLTLEEAEAETQHEYVEVPADRERARARLLAVIQRLDPIDRQLMLAYLDGLEAEEIGEITGLSSANVWTKIHRIKNVLSRRFHAGGHDGR
jgi:RNA polymerase sigma-70 factor (ECF subfamily)